MLLDARRSRAVRRSKPQITGFIMIEPETTPMSRKPALMALAGLLMLLLAGLALQAPKPRTLKKGEGDVVLFETVVARVRNGESYYPAMGSDLRSRGYPTASVFNWRMPFPLRVAAVAPKVTMVCFFALGVLAVLGTLALLMREAPEAMMVTILAQTGVTISLLKVPQFVLMSEAWAGFLIMTSLAAYGRRWWTAGAGFGVLALLVRELAAPYCLVCGVIAVAQKRWRESAVWLLGAILYVAYLLWHVSQVNAQLGLHERSHNESWIQFGGLPFVLRIISFGGWYEVLPDWSRAVGCVLLVAALWAPRASRQLRALVAAYLVFFSVVGQSFNQYWGLVTAPAFAAATGYGVTGLWRLISAARARESDAVV